MKKDIVFPVVEGIKITIARNINEENEAEWDVYLINRSTTDIDTVLVTSRGYGFDKNGEPIKTSGITSFS